MLLKIESFVLACLRAFSLVLKSVPDVLLMHQIARIFSNLQAFLYFSFRIAVGSESSSFKWFTYLKSQCSELIGLMTNLRGILYQY